MQQRLIVDVGRALTMVTVVLAQRNRAAAASPADQASAGPEDPRRKRDYYVRRLALIARAALRDQTAAYARLALEAFKTDFVAMEADTVKNQYVRMLGWRALIFALIFGAGWGACMTLFADSLVAIKLAPFLLAAVGACAGTWLSFAIRRVVLGFEDLALLEDNRMHPMARVLFVVGLTWLVGLFLESGVVNAEVNGVQMALGSSEVVALLIGAMCGIAERALAGAVGKRSEDFATRFGTIAPPPSAAGAARAVP